MIMQTCLSKVRIWVGLTLFFYASFLSAHSSAINNTIIFDNFSNPVTLVKKSSSYQVKDTQSHVQLTNRIIVGTTAQVTKKDVHQFHPQIEKVVELFTGNKRHYFSLVLQNSANLPQVIRSLQVTQKEHPEKGITLVQPDILQLQNKSENLSSQNKDTLYRTSPYIDLLDIKSLWKNTRGNNVKIAIIDDGILLSHEDLKHITPASYESPQNTFVVQ